MGNGGEPRLLESLLLKPFSRMAARGGGLFYEVYSICEAPRRVDGWISMKG